MWASPRAWVAVACLLALAVPVLRATNDKPLANDPDELVRQLGSSQFAEREAASAQLLKMGGRAFSALRRGSASRDPEVQKRLQPLLAALSNRMSSEIRGLALSRDGRTVLLGTSGRGGSIVWMHDTERKADRSSFTGPDARLSSAALSRDTRLVALTGFGLMPEFSTMIPDCPVQLWDLEKGMEIRRFPGHEGGVGRVEFSRDERRLISAGRDFTARTWDVATGKQIACFKGHSSNIVCHATFSPDGEVAVSGGCHDGKIQFWDPTTGAALRTIQVELTDIRCVRFEENGRRLAVGTGHQEANRTETKTFGVACLVRLFDVKSGKELRAFHGHEKPVTLVAFVPGGKRIISGAGDYSVRVWDIDSATELACFKTKERAILHVVVNPDGKRVSCLSYNGVFEQFDMPP